MSRDSAVIHILGRNSGGSCRCADRVPAPCCSKERSGCWRSKRRETVKEIGDRAVDTFQPSDVLQME